MPDARLGFDAGREEQELREYLGERFDLNRLRQYEHQLAAEFAAADDEQSFYRTSVAYLYNLTAFAMTGTKLPYLRELIRRVPPGARVLDYGCGIGSDGLMLLEAGYDVAFATSTTRARRTFGGDYGNAVSTRRFTTSTSASPADSMPPSRST